MSAARFGFHSFGWCSLAQDRLPHGSTIFGLPVSGAGSNEEGSPAGCVFLLSTGDSGHLCPQSAGKSLFQKLLRTKRVAQWLLLLYCFISVVWSDYPFISFKRATKIFAHPIMALIVLTEPDFKEALTRLMKRCAYVVVPVSILWIKYYPQLGTTYDDWGGATEPRASPSAKTRWVQIV